MDSFQFHIPVLGMSAWMFTDTVLFRFDQRSLLLYMDNRLILYVALYTNHPIHKKIIESISQHDFLEKLNARKYLLSMHSSSIPYFVDTLKKIFECDHVQVETSISSTSRNGIANCSFHLVDLYEMGYMTKTPVTIKYPTISLSTDPHVFTGVLIRARNPFHNFPYDYLELNFSSLTRKDFIHICFDTMLHDRPEMFLHITSIISKILYGIPYVSPYSAKRSLQQWKNYHELKVKHNEIRSIHRGSWRPGVFLKDFSRLLDIFSHYSVEYCFHFEMDM